MVQSNPLKLVGFVLCFSSALCFLIGCDRDDVCKDADERLVCHLIDSGLKLENGTYKGACVFKNCNEQANCPFLGDVTTFGSIGGRCDETTGLCIYDASVVKA